jgi:hypothetical protein
VTGQLARFTAAASQGFPEAMKLCQRADEQTIPRQHRSGHAHFIERLLVQQAELRTSLEKQRVAVLAEHVVQCVERRRVARRVGGDLVTELRQQPFSWR